MVHENFGPDAAPSGGAVSFSRGELYVRLYICVCCVPSVGDQLPLIGEAVDLRRRNTALLSGGSVVAPHRQANAKAGESTNFKFFIIYMKVPIGMMFTIYIYI